MSVRKDRLGDVIDPITYIKLKREKGFLMRKVDVAHIFPVSTHPHLRDDPDNMIYLNRWSHNCLDFLKHPITGEPITKEEQMKWWEKLAGKEKWESLMKKVNLFPL